MSLTCSEMNERTLLSTLPHHLIISDLLQPLYLSICDIGRLQRVCRVFHSLVNAAARNIAIDCGYPLHEDIHYMSIPGNRELSRSPVYRLHLYFAPRIYRIGGEAYARQVDVLCMGSVVENYKAGSLALKRNTQFAAVYHRGKIYAISACSPSSLGKVETFDFIENRWTETASLPALVVSPGAVSFRGKLYVTGGYDHSDFALKSAIYELQSSPTPEWRLSDIPALPHSRAYHSIAVLDNKLWVAGGVTQTFPTNSVDIYDPELNEWLPGPPMLVTRKEFSLLVINDQMYAVGGDRSVLVGLIGSIERYDRESRSWKYVAQFPSKRIGSAYCAVDDCIFVFGGIGISDSWDCFDTITSKWASQLIDNHPSASEVHDIYGNAQLSSEKSKLMVLAMRSKRELSNRPLGFYSGAVVSTHSPLYR